ncbi:glycosyl hydrolase 115 family protein [Aridibaculum aurantiacum]|uniref:glycosyl hydrolase 115 family protein n=1 Tax=Aridibaculum aurantiacum TaxID=2810307 RepID=UPI001A96C857|nr:glycosyl hydrolase 115 family protein [Aridibaculum aurantiacum]
MKISCSFLLISLVVSSLCAGQKNSFAIVTKQQKATIVYSKQGKALDSIAAYLLAEDIERVTSHKPAVITDISKARGNMIVIGTIGSALVKKFAGSKSSLSKKLTGQWERFGLRVVDKPTAAISKALIIAGSDARGTAYGVFTLSEKLGVSPWYWWADAPVKKQEECIISQEEFISSPPGVKYRGIFINDEDWGLQPWAAKTFEPGTGDIGPKTYAKIFELLLRLKANLIWPAMHPSTKAFFHYPGNIKTAEDYQVIIGSSHAEPMLRNNVDEWNVKTMGPFNYFTNKERIFKYWEDRIKESRGINAIYTIGMRGVHDGQMEGIKDLKEAVPVVSKIIEEEREMLAKYINKDVTAIPQVLTPYKEVLDIYDNGLSVPNDVTLVWPDDNYGYIHRLNNETEKQRKGGAGVYYHASYWGRPHDYLWLPSTHPSLLREEMMKAFETGADRLWVLNVGDIKPQEYNIQQFLDMAYNPAPFKDSRYSRQHMHSWLNSIFGKDKSGEMVDILWQYYQLAFERKPEFMGWSQTEPTTQTKYTAFNHFYYGDEAQKRIDQYNKLETSVKKIYAQLNQQDAAAFYQLVYYPVVGASFMNKKFLYRDKAYFYSRQNRLSATDYADMSKAAYDSIVKETGYYNNQLANGKWKNMMSMKPRELPVYQPPALPTIKLEEGIGWNIAPEGFVTKDSSLHGDAALLSLPAFDNLNKQQYFIDVYLDKAQQQQWIATPSHDWIRISKNSGTLTVEKDQKQVRLWVDVDFRKLQEVGRTIGTITFTGGGKQYVVNVQAEKRSTEAFAGFQGFIENNGIVVIPATGFTRKSDQHSSQWQTINGLGYTGNVLQASPLSVNKKVTTNTDSIKQSNALVEYDFHTFNAATPVVSVFALPSHPINNNYRVRYAVTVDDGPLQLIDIKTAGRSEEWKQNVLRNRAERKIQLPFLPAGKHTLKIYAVDPGVMLDEIRIDIGGLKKAYSTLPPTTFLNNHINP